MQSTHESERPAPFLTVDIDLPGRSSGKVREIFPLSGDRLLLVTTDRLSAFDRVLGAAAYKGQVLNQLSAWWFEQTRSIIPNHLLALPDPNASLVQAVKPFPVEVIVRGYITGVTSTALWHRYSLGERVIYGQRFPDGLQKNQALRDPIITPTTKGGPSGHDERLTPAEVVEKGYLDTKTWKLVQEAALEVFALGQRRTTQAGLILVDTKYELGLAPDGRTLLIDEVHTPDSSRFWLAETYEQQFAAGLEPENYDKEFIRLEYTKQGYRGDGEPPKMPASLWERVSQRYVELFERLTGQDFQPGDYPVQPRLLRNLTSSGIIA